MIIPKYVWAIVIFIIALFVGVFALHKGREYFVNTPSSNEYPKTATPYSKKKGSIKIDNTTQNVAFINMEISKGVKRYILTHPNSIVNEWIYADGSTGSYGKTTQVKNMIYLNNNKLKTDNGSKFVIGTEYDGSKGLKVNLTNGKSITFTPSS